MRALLDVPTISARLAALLGKAHLSEPHVQQLVALAALHDLGKVNAGFQRKGRNRRGRRAGHIEPLISPIADRACMRVLTSLRGAGGLKELEHLLYPPEGTPDCPEDVPAPWLAILAHHGNLPEAGAVDAGLWQPDGPYDPLAACRALVAAIRGWCPDAGPQPGLPWTNPFGHAFAGLLTLADWLGSDEEVFPLSAPEGADRFAWALPIATALVRRRNFAPEIARAASLSLTWSAPALISQSEPRPAQAAMLHPAELLRAGHICLLESETGSGKTEAALLHFLRLFRSGQVEGMYFALPTRAAAAQIHGRIEAALQALLNPAPAVVLAVPGYLRRDDTAEALPGEQASWPDQTAEALHDRLWSATRPKRYLASWVAVGTIDQLLLGGVRVRHATLRSAAMLRLLVVVDEVHANDLYMTALLRNVLVQHSSAGGHALLMSATLGSAARAALLQPRGRVTTPAQAEAVAVPYPALWSDAQPAKPVWSMNAASQPQKLVQFAVECDWSDDGAVVRHAVAAARQGARVLVIRNTVRGIVPTFLAIEEEAPDLLPAMAGAHSETRAPHHARFAPEDRSLLDAALVARLGLKARRERGCIVCATQVAEQSLDIDADLLITDLCPADVLLQRIGRLHRHRRERPAGFARPRCIVLAPSQAELADSIGPDGSVRNARLGLGFVYPDLLGVLATRQTLEVNGTVSIPGDNRRLVEAATHPDALRALAEASGPLWCERWAWQAGECGAVAQAAKAACLDWQRIVQRFPPATDEFIAVRLGLNDRSVDLPPGTLGPFGTPISTLSIPGRWLTGLPADAAAHVDVSGQELMVRLGEKTFIYDRLGLHPA